MSERVEGSYRRSIPQEAAPDGAPPPRAAAPNAHTPPLAPWLANGRLGAQAYPQEIFSNPTLRASAKATDAGAWPALPPMANPAASGKVASGCSALVAAPGNARLFAERGISLGLALKDGAFGTSGDLARFIDEYVAYVAARPEMKQLHAEALRVGPEILASRLDAEDAEAERRVEEQRMRDRLAPLEVRPPLPLQQRAAVGEVAIPIARATVAIAKLVPVAGELVILAEVATGRSMAGLGEKLDHAERAVDAALLVAPFAVAALRSGVRGAAELVRLARATGRSVQETRALCQTSVEVSRNLPALREGLAAAKAGRPLTAEQRAALEVVGDASGERSAAADLRRRTYKPSTTTDPSLPAGEGRTDKYGNTTLSPYGSAKDRALARAHESVHAYLSPKALNRLHEFRADLRMTAYEKSSLCRYLEEALAESYAQLEINGVASLPEALVFPIREEYVTVRRVVGEAAIGTIVYGGIVYGVYVTGNRK
jgi:predicted transcriptional regulator